MELPNSLEAYFQEAGRAGRDRKKAFAVLLYNQSDRLRLEKQLELSFPSMEEIRKVYRALGSFFQLAIGGGQGKSYDFDIIKFTQTYQLELIPTLNALKELEQAGLIVLTESVFLPSTLKILVSKENLYDYQIRHSKLEVIIKTILRTYQGAFQHYISLREQQLSRFLKIPQADLLAGLKKLHQDGIIDYIPQKDKPQILFTEERIDANNLEIDHHLYQFRKNQRTERLKKAIGYAESDQCRSQYLLKYFGEASPTLCGICDSCLGRNDRKLDKVTIEKYKEKIRKLLKKEQLTLEELVESFSPKRQAMILQMLTYLQDEGFIKESSGKFVWVE